MKTSPSRKRSRVAVIALLGAAATVLALLSAPAQAFPGQTTSGPEAGRVGRCYASAGPSYLGLRCITASGGDVDRKTPSEILCHKGDPQPEKPAPQPKPESYNGYPGTPNSGPNPPKGQACDPVPGCWYRPLNSKEQTVLGKRSATETGGVVYYWYRCLNGITPDRREQGPKTIDQSIAVLNFDDRPEQLMATQEKLYDYFFKGDGNDRVPQTPVIGASPNFAPRVNTDVSFFDIRSIDPPTDPPAGDPDQTNGVVSVHAGGVRLLAVENYADMSPTGDESDTFRCERRGSTNPNAASFDLTSTIGLKATEATSRANTPNACWYRFKQSSANEPEQAYHPTITAHWSVWQSEDDGQTWAPFAPNGNQVRFTKEPTGPLPLAVSEVQAVNVLPDGVIS